MVEPGTMKNPIRDIQSAARVSRFGLWLGVMVQ